MALPGCGTICPLRGGCASAYAAAMSFAGKLVLPGDLARWRAGVRAAGRRLVVTNGCFDLLHLGHAVYLEAARALGDLLLVGVNGDDSVRNLKGPSRPVNSESDRAQLLAALASVDAVCIFPETRATRFLELAAPDVYVKGGDYSKETLVGEERELIERLGAKLVLIPMVPGKSTTRLLERLGRER